MSATSIMKEAAAAQRSKAEKLNNFMGRSDHFERDH
jgi:hypothetical protein